MTKHTILFLAANPRSTEQRALDQEAASIRRELKRSGYRERFELVTRWAVEPLDLLRELRELKPAVVHFSGHGGQVGLMFQAANGDAQSVSAAAIAETFGTAGASVRLAVLSACYSEASADALLAHVDCVVGMSGVLHDDMARAFAIGFYGALGEHESIVTAYQHGNAAISLEGLSGVDRPRLRVRYGVDAAQLILAAAAPALRVALPCPYPGLRPYTADDADHFHGRDTEIEDLLSRLRVRESEIYVIGPSGTGKSSLVRAGVLPRLARGVAGLGPFLVRFMRPGEHPAARLDELLDVPHGGETNVSPADAIEVLLAGRALGSSVLIVIDQLEELFTLAEASERQRFESTLRTLRAEPRCIVVLAMRADFYSAFMESSLWTDRQGRISRIDVSPLRGEALREAIVRPARELGVHVEPTLIERILADAGSEPGVLPLLQETLVQLWDRRKGQTLTLADYRALGDTDRSALAVVVSRRADATLRAFTRTQEVIARRILLRLVSFGEGRVDTRRQQPYSKLRSNEENAADFEHVLQQMISDRLLATDGDADDGDARVDLAHEVLITAWPTLREWIRSRSEDEQRRRILEAKAAEWVHSGRGHSRLLDADELREVRHWLSEDKARDLGVSEEIQSLLARSESALAAQVAEVKARRRRARRQTTAAILVLAGVLVAVSTLAVKLTREARRQRIRDYISQGHSLLMNGHPAQAIPYLLAARESGANDIPLRALFRWATRDLPIRQFVHHGDVWSVAWSPDGRRVATASGDKTARVWDTVNGQPVTPPLVHHGIVSVAAWSPDGRWVATASSDRTARVWNAFNGQAVTPPLVHHGVVYSVAWSPDGRRVATASSDGTARVWDASSGQPLTQPLAHQHGIPGRAIMAVVPSDGRWMASDVSNRQLVGPPLAQQRGALGWVAMVAWSPDGQRVATASADGTARVWDAVNGQQTMPPLVHRRWVLAVAWSPDGRRVATASGDGTARVWDAFSGHPVTPPLGHTGGLVWTVAWSPNGKLVATASGQIAQVWDASSGQRVTPPLEHQSIVMSLAWSPEGQRLATVSLGQPLKMWDVVTGQVVTPPFLANQSLVDAVAWSPDGRRLVTASDEGTVRVWDVVSRQALTPPLAHQQGIQAIAWSPSGRRVVTASDDWSARVWDAGSGQAISPPVMHQGSVRRAVWSPDGRRFATASSDNTARVWDAHSGQALTPPLMHTGWVTAVAWSPDGRRIATASGDGTARVWDAGSGQAVTPPLEHQSGVLTVAWSPDGNFVATADSQRARVWDAVSGRAVAMPPTHDGAVIALSWSPDGRRIATASGDQTARVWDAFSGEPVTPPLVHQNWLSAVAWSPDGTRIATASWDQTARVWDAVNGRAVTPPLAHQDAVMAVAWSPDGARVATASKDHTAKVWDAISGMTVTLPLVHQGWVTQVAWSPDGTRIATTSEDHTAQIWDVSWNRDTLTQWRAILEFSDYRLNDDDALIVKTPRRHIELPRTVHIFSDPANYRNPASHSTQEP